MLQWQTVSLSRRPQSARYPGAMPSPLTPARPESGECQVSAQHLREVTAERHPDLEGESPRVRGYGGSPWIRSCKHLLQGGLVYGNHVFTVEQGTAAGIPSCFIDTING